MADVIPFGRRPGSVEELLAAVSHLPEPHRFDALRRHVARAMNEAHTDAPSEWVNDAILLLKEASSGHVDGGVEVSVSALHLVLSYIEHLEGRLGLIPQPDGPA